MPVHKRLALAVVAMALAAAWVSAKYGSRSAGGADSYGYISQADAWISGELVQHQPFTDLAEARPPFERWVIAPLGWKPAPGSWDVVPTYAPGYPLMLAAAKRTGGHRAMFLVVPFMTGVLIWSTYLLGARLGRAREGTLAALLVATSATVLYMSMAPMSDVPSAALWTLTLALVLSRSRASAFGAGAVCALAILVRPNLSPLALIMAAWLVVNDRREHRSWRSIVQGCALPFSLVASSGAIATAVINSRWYGKATESGYGDLGGLFAMAHVPTNAANYLRWLFQAETPLAIAGLLVVLIAPQFLSRRRDVAGVPLLLWTLMACLWGQYLIYRPFEWWWYLRFLLPAWPLIALGSACLIGWLWERRGASRIIGAVIGALAVSTTLWFAWKHDAFRIGLTESRYPQIARGTATLTDPQSGILTLQHSGSVRYYGGRMTLRWDLVPPGAFTSALAWMRSHGHHAYLLIDAVELPAFRARFAGDPALALIDAPPLAAFFRNETMLFDLDVSEPRQATTLGTYTRRAIEPVAPPKWMR
jgi:hypothetical protein